MKFKSYVVEAELVVRTPISRIVQAPNEASAMKIANAETGPWGEDNSRHKLTEIEILNVLEDK